MNVLALEPYYGGSHKAFLDGWSQKSRHQWTIIGLPPYKWKWRMRHAPMTLSQKVLEYLNHGSEFDIIFCSDMLNLAEFKGLTPAISHLPAVIYFHENQLTYPVQNENERDYHYGFSNFTSAVSADAIWFNSTYHKNSFYTALENLLSRMPDFNCHQEFQSLENKSAVHYPGIDILPQPLKPLSNPPHLLWAARWEHDKNPLLFFNTMYKLQAAKSRFSLSVIGESFDDVPPVFLEAQQKLKDHIVHFGYQDSRQQYLNVLKDADIIISTADHEFFGIAVVEAAAMGLHPLLPDRLAYPEIFKSRDNPNFFYDGSEQDLYLKLHNLVHSPRIETANRNSLQFLAQYTWTNLTRSLDNALEMHCKN